MSLKRPSIQRITRGNKVLLILISITIAPLKVHCVQEYILSCGEAVDMALEKSRKIELALLRHASSSELYKLGIREFLPSLNLSFSSDDAVQAHRPDSHLKRMTFSLLQPVFRGGRISFRRKIEGAELLREAEEIQLSRVKIIDTVWSLYHQALIAEEKLEIEKETYRLSLDQLKIAKIEKEIGVITELEFIETELNSRNLEIALAETSLEVEKLYSNLKQAVRLPLSSKLVLKDRVSPAYRGMVLMRSPDFYTALAERRNSEMRSLKYQLMKKQLEYKAGRRRFLPSVDLEASLFFEAERFPLNNPGFTVKIDFSFPSSLFPSSLSTRIGARNPGQRTRGGALQTAVAKDVTYGVSEKRLTLEIQSCRLELERFRESLAFEIRRSMETYRYLVKKTELYRQTLDLGDKRLRILEERMKLGEIKRADYLEANIEQAEKKIQLLGEVLGLLTAERDIERLIGLQPGELSLYEQGKEEGP